MSEGLMIAAEMPVKADAHVEEADRTLTVEIAALERLRTSLAEGMGSPFSRAVSLVLGREGRVILTGMGKSGHIARKIAATLSSTGTPSLFVHPGEASHGDLGAIMPADAVLALSWSGETRELSDIVGYTRRFGIPLIAITSRADSTLGRTADVALVLPVVEEACPNGLAPTSSTTMQLALGDAFAMALLRARGFSSADFRNYHPGGKLGAQIRPVSDLMHRDEIPLVRDGATMHDAVIEMTSRRFGTTGVVDAAGRIVGLVTDGDLRRALGRDLATTPVADVMTRTPLVIEPGLTANEALAMMNRMKITVLFVVEEDRPIGILHIHDLLRAGVA
ncbi:KpsF/GutQ family sugar-phosphate isomerase [Muricoccus radiodurans]|uniref:KpsF/GutQ family sugar-phosphate isomerase n=1 Tax=Muricoccus radiodurans TaxID=2231721 RepID=UPI003CF9CBF0